MAYPIEDIRREIEATFEWRLYPGDDKLTSRGSPQSEDEEAREFFSGKHWREIIPGANEITVRDYMGLLRFEGWVYYLPAFLLLSLNVDECSEVGDSLVHRLWSFPEEISALLTPAEKRVVVHVLEYLAEENEKRGYHEYNNDAFVALDHYWAYFTDEELGISRDEP